MIFKVKGQLFRRGDTPRFALPLFNGKISFLYSLFGESSNKWIMYINVVRIIHSVKILVCVIIILFNNMTMIYGDYKSCLCTFYSLYWLQCAKFKPRDRKSMCYKGAQITCIKYTCTRRKREILKIN